MNYKIKEAPGCRARSAGLSQWAVRLHLCATCLSLCRSVHSAVGGIRNKAKVIWTGAHKHQACVWVRMGQLCRSNKWPHDFNGLQQQRFIFYSCYKSKVGLLWFWAIFFTPGPKLTHQSPSKNIASHCDLRENTKFANYAQFYKASAWKRSTSLLLTFHWPKHAICLFLVRRAGIYNPPTGRGNVGRVIWSTVIQPVTLYFHFHGRKAKGRRNN